MSSWKNSEKILLKRLNFKNKKILDIGCGNGWFSLWTYENEANDIYAIDPNKEQIKIAKKKNKNIHFDIGNAENLNYEDNKFDLVFFFNSLHHVPKNLMGKSLIEALRVVKKLGLIIVVEPLAEGNFNEILKVIDDEMEIRFAAYNAIKQLFHENSCSEEIFYNEIKEFTSFTNFSNFISSVDPSRKIKIEKNRKKIEVLFYKLSNKLSNKFKFIQPMRMNVIKNNGS